MTIALPECVGRAVGLERAAQDDRRPPVETHDARGYAERMTPAAYAMAASVTMFGFTTLPDVSCQMWLGVSPARFASSRRLTPSSSMRP